MGRIKGLNNPPRLDDIGAPLLLPLPLLTILVKFADVI